MAIGKNVFFVANGVRLHDALKSFSPSMESDELDSTTLGTTGGHRSFVPGFRSGTLSMEGVWDYDTTNEDEIDDVLKAAFGDQTATQILASYGTIVNGEPALMVMDGKVLSYGVTNEIGQLIMASAEVRSDNGIESGKWHFDGSATSTTSNGTSVDNAASSANGGYYQGHLYLADDSTATNGSFTLQHSTDNSVWVDVEAIQAVGATKGAVSREVTGTINRYTRIVFTATGGKGYGVAAFVRR